MKQAEIEFCEWWRSADVRTIRAYNEHRKPYSDCWRPLWSGLLVAHDKPHMVGPADLGPRGADLVASYEAALVLGLDIVADDAPKTSGRIDCDPDGRERAGRYDDCEFCVGDACNRCGWDLRMGNTRGCDCDVVDRHEPRRAPREPSLVDCPDCDDGTIGIPVAYAANGGVLRVWPSTCQRCEGSGQVEELTEIGRPIEGLGQHLDGWFEWGGWGKNMLASLVGKTVEARLTDGRTNHPPLPPSEVSLIKCPQDGPEIFTNAWTLRNSTCWEIRVVDEPKTVDPRDLEWRQLTGEVAEGLVGKIFEMRAGPESLVYTRQACLLSRSWLHLDAGGPAFCDGSWWVRGVA